MDAPAARAFSHAALLYSAKDEYSTAAEAFARGAASAGNGPLLVAAPRKTLDILHGAMGWLARKARWAGTVWADMDELGRNPARIIPALRTFAAEHPGSSLYCLLEPVWPARTTAEVCEVARHEALCGIAFHRTQLTVLCCYDVSVLGDDVIESVALTHPVLAAGGNEVRSLRYLGPGQIPPACAVPLPAPGQDARSLRFETRLDAVRAFVARQSRAAGIGDDRCTDFVIAVSELAANAVVHAHGNGVIRCWCTSDELLCQIEDAGYITDPLAAAREQPSNGDHGYGLWLVNEVCDLVERRTGPDGTTTRLHMRRHPR